MDADFSMVSSRRPIPILTYHQIAPAPAKGTGFRSLSVAPADFAAQMCLLKRLGWQGMSMSDLLPYLGGERQGKVFGITFDDGYLNNLTHAAPVLTALGFSSTCYVVAGMLGKTNAWDADKGVPLSPLMDIAQIREWMQAGQEVGAHTCQHVHLPALESGNAWLEICGSKRLLEADLGTAVHHFCYPYGEYLPHHVEQVMQAGYRTATTTHRGRCSESSPLLELPRVPVLRRTSLALLWWKLVSRYEDRRRL